MGTNFDAMSHEQIYHAVKSGTPTTVSGAATDLTALNHTISGHLDTLDKLSTSMADAWPDENGRNFRSTLSDTIAYLRELQSTHVVSASSSITQVMSASHEKLSHTQTTIPPPPAVPVADQEKALNQQSAQHDGAQTAGMAAEGQHIAAAKADDAKAVALAKSLANTYLVEKAKLTAPPAAPTGPANNGAGAPSTAGGANGTSSNHAMGGYSPGAGSGGSTSGPAGGGTSGGASFGTGGGAPTLPPVHNGGGTGGLDGSNGGSPGSDGGASGGLTGSNHGTVLDPNSNGPRYDDHGNLLGGGNFGPPSIGSPGSGAPPVSGVLGAGGFGPGGPGGPGSGGSGGGGGSNFGSGALVAVGGGLAAAAVIAARREAAQRAAVLRQELSQEELAANGGGGSLSASQLAAINAQRNGILSAGQQAGLIGGDRAMMSAQPRGLLGANGVMSAQEEAQLAANQRVVPGQLGATPGSATATGARTGMPFAGGGVVGGAERVTWLVEDRDLFSADPGVRAIIED